MPIKQFDLNQRMKLEALLKAETPITQIAAKLGKARKTIYNEIERNSTSRGYSAERADKLALERRTATKPSRPAKAPKAATKAKAAPKAKAKAKATTARKPRQKKAE